MGTDEAPPTTAENRVAERAAEAVVESTAVLTRQRYVTFFILLLTAWVARGFLLPLACAALLAIAEWPHYRRALRRYPRYGGLLSVVFSLATALLVILPISLIAVTVAQESQTAIGWVKEVQLTGLAEPSWLGHLPLVGTRADQVWREDIGSPRAASSLLAA